MAKVFTITEGLENLGAMKTGGQGSVYKGRRIGEIITAIKLLPTPVYSETLDDKNYRDFQNEVQKLKKVNEQPNPHVVTILSSGVTDSGNFPYIEMEYIEGPDLEELLKPPHDPIFSITELLKINNQLADALAHCHRLDVKHGDIKSNNVKFNTKTGNYILLDFGLSAMSDEQRRTSLRHAGAIEFMAPEQNEGQMFFQTDVYSFGIILFEMVAGRVPFPLNEKGETARNVVRLHHMETPVPDVLELRRQAMPESWPEEKKEREMQVPAWLISMIYKCVEKKPESRFANGVELHEYINSNSSNAIKVIAGLGDPNITSTDANKLIREKELLQKRILEYQEKEDIKDKELQELRALVASGNIANTNTESVYDEPVERGVSKSAFAVVLLIAIGLAAFSAFNYFKSNGSQSQVYSDTLQNKIDSLVQADTTTRTEDRVEVPTRVQKDTARPVVTDEPTDNTSDNTVDTVATPVTENTDEPKPEPRSGTKYTVISKAYFHDKPSEATRRDGFIVYWNNAVLTPLGETSDFIYIEYTNKQGQTSKGWLRKADLKPVN